VAEQQDQGLDGVTHGEIVRGLRELREEIRALRGEHVRRDLYDAHRATVGADVSRLEVRLEQVNARLDDAEGDRATFRRSLTLVGLTAALSLLVQLVLVLIR